MVLNRDGLVYGALMSETILSRPLGRVVRAVLVLAIGLFVVLGVAGVVAMGNAVLGAGVLLVLLVVLTVDPNTIKQLVVKPTEISLTREIAAAQAAAAGAPPEEQYDSVQPSETGGDELTDVRLHLEAKLSYIAGQMNLDSGIVNIGSMRHDGYLTDAEAKTADRVLTMSPDELAKAPREQREAFLAAARELVGSIRASVLAGAIRKELRRQGWDVGSAGSGKRDIRASHPDGRVVSIVPLFVVARESELLLKVRQRLADANGADRRIIVLPSNSATPTTSSDSDPAVVKIDELEAALQSSVR